MNRRPKSRDFKENNFNKALRKISIQRVANSVQSKHRFSQKQILANIVNERHQENKLKDAMFSTINKKQKYKTQKNHNVHKTSCHQTRESKKNIFNNTFIGSKLKLKLQKYLFFISLINYSLKNNWQKSIQKRYKIYIGRGNNSKIIKDIFKRRFWWSITSNEQEANIIWTQTSKKEVLNKITDYQYIKSEQIQTKNEIINLKKKKQNKKHNLLQKQYNEYQKLLINPDYERIKKQLSSENYIDQFKNFIKKNKFQKRRLIKLTHNHLQNHRMLTNKKNLFKSLSQYCEQNKQQLFTYIPLTFHIKNLQQDMLHVYLYQQKNQLCKQGQKIKQKDKLLWIVKPGQNSNRGSGIQVCKKADQVKKHIQKQIQKHPNRTFIVQKYIYPFLFHRRKFDIRCFVLVIANPHISAYFYQKGYIRTSSFQFSMKNCTNKFIHLTNDAVQKKATQYSKYENGNKVTFQQFQKYLDLFASDKKINFNKSILPQIKKLASLSIKSTNNFNQSMKQYSFQIFGYDFMLDQNLKPWLIQINTNPCLQTNCQVLVNIIPDMLENAVKIAVDPVFKPPKLQQWGFNELINCQQKLFEDNEFSLIYNQNFEQKKKMYQNN